MATSSTEKKAWTVITPAGNIYCDYASEANEYKNLYNYLVFKTSTINNN